MQPRLGTAYAQAGRPVDAVLALDPYIAQHPQDHERLLVALKAIYDARSAGKSITTAEEDRKRFERYAAAYAAAGGPQQALVEQMFTDASSTPIEASGRGTLSRCLSYNPHHRPF